MSKQTLAVTLSLAALAAAQGLGDLSAECQAGINGLSSNNEASSCLALNQLTNILLTPANQTVIAPVNNWLTAFCGAPVCSDSTIQTVIEAITTACATDIAALGATGEQAQVIIPYVQQYFGVAKNVLCLANTSSDEFCTTELAEAAEKDLGKPFTVDNLVETLGGVVSTGSNPVNASIACTPCTQGAIFLLNQEDSSIGSTISPSISTTCGSEFVASATALPANVVVGTGSAVPKGTGGNGGGDGAGTLAVAASLATVAGTLLVVLLA